MSDWLAALLLGLIEGLTEFIPVSSTGHLLLAEQWLPRQTDLFNIVVQSGAAVALVPLFWGKSVALATGFREARNRDFLAKLATAFLITCAGGVVLENLGHELPSEAAPVAWATLVGGLVMLSVEAWSKGRILSDEVTWQVAIAVGIGQLIAAVFPGASRSASTIMIAMMLGLGRPAATEFSFMVGVPTLLAAGGAKIFRAFAESAGSVPWDAVAVGTVAAALSSFLVARWLITYVRTHTFNGFAVYRIVLGAGLLAFTFGSWR